MYEQLLLMTPTGHFAVDVGPTSDFLQDVFITAQISYSFSSARVFCVFASCLY